MFARKSKGIPIKLLLAKCDHKICFCDRESDFQGAGYVSDEARFWFAEGSARNAFWQAIWNLR